MSLLFVQVGLSGLRILRMIPGIVILLIIGKVAATIFNESDPRGVAPSAKKVFLGGFLDEAEKKSLAKVVADREGTFLAGNLHHYWVTHNEKSLLTKIATALIKAKEKNGQCSLIDCGMNDGFYTMLGGFLGCIVHSYEIQDACISYAKKVMSQNVQHSMIPAENFHKVEIHRSVISNVVNDTVEIPFPASHLCDGGFTMTGAVNTRMHRMHAHMALTRMETFTTQTLATSFAGINVIDVLKVDVEGHEGEVLAGADSLLKANKIKMVVFEAQVVDESGFPTGWVQPEEAMDVVKTILGYGYSARFMPTCHTLGTLPPAFSVHDFKKLRKHLLNKYRHYDCVDLELFLQDEAHV